MSGIVNVKGRKAAILYNVARWHLARLVGGREFPLAATFQLTNRCNLRCVMCNIPNNPDLDSLTLTDFTAVVEELASMGCCFASLSGGEVLTIPRFFDYLRAAKSNLPTVNTVTNGLLLDKVAAVEFAAAGADSVSVSLDGMEHTHEKTRARVGSFARTVEAVETLRTFAPGVKVVVNTVIAPWNISELKELALFVERLGVRQKFQPLNEHPTFEGQAREYDLGERTVDKKEAEDLVDFLMRRKSVVNSRYFLRSIPAYLSGEPRGRLFTSPCVLPRFLCEFREDGRMYPCLGGKDWKGGYPVGTGIKDIFHSPEYREDVARLRDCRFCRKSYSVCYIEPRVTFPVTSYLRYRLLGTVFG